MVADEPELLVPDASGWRAWLDQHADEATAVRLVLAKKGTTVPTALTYEQAVEEALCQGWVDGLTHRRDQATYRMRFTPRRPRSTWSVSNVTRVARLVEQGRMAPRGQAEVDRARADGRWPA